MRSVFILLLGVALVYGDVVEKVAQQAEKAIDKATSGTARQCTCDEQHECVIELEAHGKECMDSCWDKFNKIAKNPDKLRECFHEHELTVGSLITCFEDEATTCAKEKTEKQVPKVDMHKLINIGTQKILNIGKNATAALSDEIKEVTDTLGKFGLCVKDCVIEKNSGGFCFDKKGCQPLLDEKEEAKQAAKKCAKQVDFRKHAGEICECAKTAGVENLNKFCPLLKNVAEGVKDAVKGSH